MSGSGYQQGFGQQPGRPYQPSQMTFGQQPFGAFQSPGYGQRFGSTQDLGNGMNMKQMGPSMLPFRSSGPDYFPQRPLPFQQNPTVDYFPQRPGSQPSMVAPENNPMQKMGPDGIGHGGVSNFPARAYPYMPPTLPQPTPQPAPQPTPNQSPPPPPGVTTDPSGRMTYGGQPVKFDGTRYVYDTTPFVPGAGQWGQYGAPGAGGFTLDQSSGKNMILGGANGPQMYNAEGLVQGGQAPQNFVNYLNSYRR